MDYHRVLPLDVIFKNREYAAWQHNNNNHSM